MMLPLDQILAARLEELTRANRLRCLRPIEAVSSGRLTRGGRALLDFASNDYLGLKADPALVRRACEFAQRWGAGTGSSRLISGNLAPFESIEAKLARGKGTEAALLFSSGFQANVALVPALLDLLGSDCQVFSDRLNHASLHLGCQAARVRQHRYRHNDLSSLEELLEAHAGGKRPSLILTETVFSMDGDRADVAGLVALSERYGAALLLDEAHATGVFGPNGFGLSVGHRADLVMGTFSKALGSFGAYVACSAKMREYLINRCAGFIYTTALPPAALGAIDAALDLLPGLEDARCRLLAAADGVRCELRRQGFDVGASESQIIPVILGDEQRVLAAAQRLEEEGFAVGAVRPPTVPSGQSRLRVALSACHSEDQVAALTRALGSLAS